MQKRSLCLLTVSFLLFGCLSVPSSDNEPLNAKREGVTPNEMRILDIGIIKGNAGNYMSPITSKGTLTAWVKDIFGDELTANSDQSVFDSALVISIIQGAFRESNSDPSVDLNLSQKSFNGDLIQEISDTNFNNIEEVIVFIYANYNNQLDLKDIVSATVQTYSDMIDLDKIGHMVKSQIKTGVSDAASEYVSTNVLKNVPGMDSAVGGVIISSVIENISFETVPDLEHVRKTSDISFNSLSDLAVYLYAYYGNNPNYYAVLSATSVVYPELEKLNESALFTASALARATLDFN